VEKQSINHPLMLPKLLMNAKQLLIGVAEKFNLTSMQVCMLILVEPDQPRAMSSLAHVLRNDASNITGLVDRLQRQKLVERRDDPNDRRIKMISLTPQGKKTRAAILTSMQAAEGSMLKNLTAQEQVTIRNLLNKI
jgi:MarR family transcriptional regulator, organic hydroperoxide resistance regulator